MDGFKNSTRTQYDTGCGYAKGGAAKIGKVMGEFAAGKLHSGSKKGPEVTSKKQAMAIAMSEANSSKKPVKKAHGGRPMTEQEMNMAYEDRMIGLQPEQPLPRKALMVRNARAAAPKREPMVVAKKTTVTMAPKTDMMPKNANAVERLLAMKAGRPLKKGGSVKGSKVPVSEKATGETYVSKKAMMKHEASEPRATKMAEGEIKKQVGGMATSVRSTPEAEARDRGFIEARSVPMREMVNKSGYKKGGKTGYKMGGSIPC